MPAVPMPRSAAAFLAAFAAGLLIPRAAAHEGVGRAGFKDPEGVEVEGEFYAGRHGYLHGGLGAIYHCGEDQKVGMVGHFVREDAEGEIFPSLGAEYVRTLGGGFELEVFSFGYLPVERQHAWALGLRGSRAFETNGHLVVSPFFGPTFAWVRAIEEASDDAVDISHLMLLGGVDVVAGPVDLTLFGSVSCFSRDEEGLETHVDLEEMTHFAAYENNDGFARHTLGMEVKYQLTESVALEARYAWIGYKDRIRHAISFTPSVQLNPRWEIFAGVQLLRGDDEDNTLGVTGATVSF